MSKVRPDKVATVDEVASRAGTTSTAVVTQYRGLTVAQISALRRQLRVLGADYKVFKNTLVRRAIAGTPVESLAAFLEGPTAIAFIDGDVSAVAKALRDFARETPSLIVRGGVMGGKALSAADLSALADLPSRDVLLAQMAGLLASPLRTMAGLLKAVPQNFAYGLAALLDSKGGAPVADAPAEPVEDVLVDAVEVAVEPAEVAPIADVVETPEVAAEVADETPPEVVADTPAETADDAPAEAVADTPSTDDAAPDADTPAE